jgi:hypothetical protein
MVCITVSSLFSEDEAVCVALFLFFFAMEGDFGQDSRRSLGLMEPGNGRLS